MTTKEEHGYAERLSAVNKGLKFTDIRGKQYAQVNQRILAFWSLFPEGRIVPVKESDNGERVDFRCEVYRHKEDTEPVTVGHSFEEKKGTINATSYIENGETSAIGRALGLLGIGANTSIASAEEMINALAQQEANESASKAKQEQAKATKSEAKKAPAYDPQKWAARIVELEAKCLEAGYRSEDIEAQLTQAYGTCQPYEMTKEQQEACGRYLNDLLKAVKENQ